MNDTVQVSVVIPVYNVEKYLDACVRSVLGQTYADFELILVDDGSTDGSPALCDGYAAADSRVRVIHQKNGGLSAARNAGIRQAKGQYITFVDSDDFVSPVYIERLYRTIVEADADLCMGDIRRVSEKATPEAEEPGAFADKPPVVFDNEEVIREVYGTAFHGADFVSYAKLYRTDLFRENAIEFPVGKLHEDTFTTYKLMYFSKKILYLDEVLYFYRMREGSITNSAFSARRLDMLLGTRAVYQFFRSEDKPELMRLALFDHFHKGKYVLRQLCASPDNKPLRKAVCRDLEQDLRENREAIPFAKYCYYKGLAKFPKLFLRLRR